MLSLVLSVIALGLSIYSTIQSQRAWREALGNLLWVELSAGAWDVPRWMQRLAMPENTGGTIRFRRHDPFHRGEGPWY
jgi:hypothetical protein